MINLKYFKLSEFDSPDAKGSGDQMNERTVIMLDKAREIAETPFKINSGYRTPEHNRRVGGSSNSSHMKGCAVDIHCNNSQDRHKILKALREVGFNRIGIADTFIHVDNDTVKVQNVTWLY